MNYPNYSAEEQKILELIYSNIPANDLITFEIIRQGNYGKKFLAIFKCVNWTATADFTTIN